MYRGKYTFEQIRKLIFLAWFDTIRYSGRGSGYGNLLTSMKRPPPNTFYTKSSIQLRAEAISDHNTDPGATATPATHR
jgi:hypothetical protein